MGNEQKGGRLVFYVKSRRIGGMDDVRIDSNVVHTADSTRLHVENASG